MKRTLFVFLVITGFISCKSKPSAPTRDSIVKASTPVNPNEALIQKFKPIIEGVWVKSDYIEKVIKTKSPLAAEDLAEGITIINLKTDNIKGDSVTVLVGWDNHEGGDIVLKFRPGKKTGTIQFGDYDLGYSVKNGDTTLILYDFKNDQRNYPITKYKKATNERSNDLGKGMDYLINKGLIAGKYKLTDSLGANTNVIFFGDGKVSGLSNFTTYYIQFDRSQEPMMNLDEIDFDLSSKNHKTFTYKINGDTLNLYNEKANADSTLLVFGKLKYKLVRQK